MLLRELDDGLALHRVSDLADGDPFRDGFIAAYRRVFARPPYEEAFSDDDAQAVWRKLLTAPHQVTLIATAGSQVVGFASAIPLSSDPVIARELMGLVPARHTMYLAELGVEPPYDEVLARALNETRIRLIDPEQWTHLVLRAPGHIDATLALYRDLGFTEMGASMVVTRERVDGTMRGDRRHFFGRVASQVPLGEE